MPEDKPVKKESQGSPEQGSGRSGQEREPSSGASSFLPYCARACQGSLREEYALPTGQLEFAARQAPEKLHNPIDPDVDQL